VFSLSLSLSLSIFFWLLDKTVRSIALGLHSVQEVFLKNVIFFNHSCINILFSISLPFSVCSAPITVSNNVQIRVP